MFDPMKVAEAALERLKAEDSSFPSLPKSAQARFIVVVETEARRAFAEHVDSIYSRKVGEICSDECVPGAAQSYETATHSK